MCVCVCGMGGADPLNNMNGHSWKLHTSSSVTKTKGLLKVSYLDHHLFLYSLYSLGLLLCNIEDSLWDVQLGMRI